ncbi:MAG TPA: T9SS type A sorting domain-containing protein [Chitinophagaceae bacterium]|nr:T9SS type A sorting domain-containing protein [Chitinophagaceae bacterium]
MRSLPKALMLCLPLLACMFTGSTAKSQITVNIINPAHLQVVEDNLSIRATVTSNFQLNTVTATVSGRQTTLVFNAATGWTGQLNLAGLPLDTLNVVVEATDVFSNSNSANRDFIHDQAPVFTLDSILHGSLARPLIRVKGSATDNMDSVQLTVLVNNAAGTYTVGTFYNSVDTVIDLSQDEGRSVFVRVVARDKVNLTNTHSGEVFVESSPYLEEIFSSTSMIADFNYNKVFTGDDTSPGNLRLIDITTNATENIPYSGGITTSGQFLTMKRHIITPQGVLFPQHEWNNGMLYQLPYTVFGSQGNFALLYANDSLYIRDLTTRENTFITKSNQFRGGDVGANGVAFYGVARGVLQNLEKWENNSISVLLSNHADTSKMWPRTDGQYVAYSKLISPNTVRIAMHDGTSEIELSDLGNVPPDQSQNRFRVKNKFVAYIKTMPGGVDQVWLRDSTGANIQLTFFGNDSEFEELGENGDVTFLRPAPVTDRRWHSTKTGVLQEIGGGLGIPVFRDTAWYFAIGRKLLKLNLNIPSNSISSFQEIVAPNTTFAFNSNDFASNFYGPGNLVYVKITRAPAHGMLRNTSTGQFLSLNSVVARNQLNTLVYIPDNGYIGRDTIGWDASNSIDYTGTTAFITMNVGTAPLPVKLTHFTGVLDKGIVMLTWKTATEQNTRTFEVQRSTDGVNFARIGNVTATGSINGASYAFQDLNPAIGYNYYRLKIIDEDGKYDHSIIVIINTKKDGKLSVTIYPNPTPNNVVSLNINGRIEGNCRIDVVDMNGKQVMQRNLGNMQADSYTTTLNLGNIQKGTYFIKLAIGDKLLTHRIVVQ